MIILSKEVFPQVESPFDFNGTFKEEFLNKSTVEQLKWVNDYKERKLEMKIYDKVANEGKTLHEVFCYDQEIDMLKRDLAKSRYAMLKATRNSDRDYVMSVSRHSYSFTCPKTEDVATRFAIYRQVKGMSIRPYLEKDAQTSYNFF